MKLALILFITLLSFCTSSPVTGTDNVLVVIRYEVTPPDGVDNIGCIYADGDLVHVFLDKRIDSVHVREGAALEAQFMQKYYTGLRTVDTTAAAGMTWILR